MAGRACRRHGPVSAQRRPLVGPLTLALLLLLLQLALVSGQAVIDYSELPKCAYSCTLLAQAQGACVPPQAQTTNQQTYESCFCQSAYLRTLYSSANGVCDAFCGPDDLLKIQDWYTGRCQSVSAPTPGSGPPPSLRKSPSWMSTHWKWVLFVIVIFLAGIFFSVLGVWLRRRIHRKRDLAGANVTANRAVDDKAGQAASSPSIRPASVGQRSPLPTINTTTTAAAAVPNARSIERPSSGMSQLTVPRPAAFTNNGQRPRSRVYTPDPNLDGRLNRSPGPPAILVGGDSGSSQSSVLPSGKGKDRAVDVDSPVTVSEASHTRPVMPPASPTR